MTLSTAVSGVVALFSREKSVIFTALIVTLVGVSIGMIRLLCAQKKVWGRYILSMQILSKTATNRTESLV